MLSVIIPARNDGPMTARCLEHALGSVDRLKLRCEFILVDDASPPEEGILELFRQTRARGAPHHFTIIRARTRQHYTQIFSIGLSFAAGDPIFFLSNDMLVTPSFLGAQLMVSALDPAFGIVRGTSNYVDSHPEHQVIPDPMPATYPAIEAFSRSIAEANGCAYVEDKVLSGDAVLIKRALVERIGVLDTRFFGYFGDMDYGMRAYLAGFKLVCAKGAWLFHRGGGYVHRESQLAGEADVKAAYRRRLEIVEEAYAIFRAKWGIERPLRYSEVQQSYFFGQAEAAASTVPLKCEMPESILNDVELY